MFNSSVPVTASAFFDRERERGQILQAIEQLQRGAPRWLCLVGPRKVGKTSLLLEVARQLHCTPSSSTKHPPHVVVLDVFDLLPVSTELFRELALRAVDATLSLEAGLSLHTLAREPARYRQAVVATRSFKKLGSAWQSFVLELPVAAANAKDFVRDCLDLPEQLAVATNGCLVVAIDELQELAAFGSTKRNPDPLPLMRSVWQRHKKVSYIVSGSARTLLLELTTSKHSPFFQHFTVMEVGPFSEAAAVSLLTAASETDGPIARSLAQQVFATVGGNPFYLQVLGEALSEHPDLARNPQRALKECLQQVLFSRAGRLALYFANEYQRLVGRAATLAAVLESLAEGPARLTDIAHAIRSPTGATLVYLERLGDAVVRTEAGQHALADPTFALWLRWRRPGGTILPMKLVGDEGERLSAEYLAGLGFEVVYQSRGSRGAFDLLAARGPFLLAVQVKHRPLPLRFTRAEWNRMTAEAERYGWRWAVAAVDAASAVTLLDPAKAQKGRTVSLSARATIENVLTWVDSCG